MKVTEVKLYKSNKDGIVKAFGKATLDDELVLDVLIMDKGDGAWATFPNGKKSEKDQKFYLPVFWKTKEKDQEFKAEVIKAYNELGGGTSTGGTTNTASTGGSENLPF